MAPSSREEQIRKDLIEKIYLGGTSTCSIEAAGIALLGLAMTRIADAVDRAEAREAPRRKYK